MQMVIGTMKWSTWSMRPWLVARRAGVQTEDIVVPLRAPETSLRLEAFSPSAQCPVLIDGGVTVWDSLAICEYLAERFPEARLWPEDAAARAQGRAAAAQMHGGFASLRGECSMDLSAPIEALELTEATAKDVAKLVRLWSMLLTRHGGPYLLGRAWSIADAFYTPVATRIRTYAIDLAAHGDADGACAAYAARLLTEPEFLEWERRALSAPA
ncbi:MAG TPA: glutathione S-transferase [Caulobacteraceae bacterium]|nr:glutathione S-transferase [Caulobacteraceae bacterium]